MVMDPDRASFISFLVDSGCLRFGDFTLKSGAASPFFVNLGDITTGPELETLGRALARVVADHVEGATVLFGPAYKGIPMATAVAMSGVAVAGRVWALCYDRKEAKGHGEGGRYIGQLPTPADVVVIIDDVLSSGGTKLEAAAGLEQAFGARPAAVVVAVDRRQAGHELPAGFPPVHAVVTITDLADWLDEQGDTDRAGTVRRFYRDEA